MSLGRRGFDPRFSIGDRRTFRMILGLLLLMELFEPRNGVRRIEADLTGTPQSPNDSDEMKRERERIK